MLLIRKQQLDAFSASSLNQYCQRLAKFFRDTVPEVTAKYTNDELLALITEGVHKVRGHGIQTGTATARFIGLMLLVSPRFDEDPAVQRYFKIPELDPDYKSNLLADLVTKQIRAKAKSL